MRERERERPRERKRVQINFSQIGDLGGVNPRAVNMWMLSQLLIMLMRAYQ